MAHIKLDTRAVPDRLVVKHNLVMLPIINLDTMDVLPALASSSRDDSDRLPAPLAHAWRANVRGGEAELNAIKEWRAQDVRRASWVDGVEAKRRKEVPRAHLPAVLVAAQPFRRGVILVLPDLADCRLGLVRGVRSEGVEVWLRSVLSWRRTHNVVARLVCMQVVPAVKMPVDEVYELVVAAHELNQPRDVVLPLAVLLQS